MPSGAVIGAEPVDDDGFSPLSGDESYANARVPFHLTVPAKFERLRRSANGDGFSAGPKDGAFNLNAWGCDYQNCNFDEDWDRESSGATYKVKNSDWFVVSGLNKTMIFYEKELRIGRMTAAFRLEFPQARKSEFDSIIKQLVTSFGSDKVNPKADFERLEAVVDSEGKRFLAAANTAVAHMKNEKTQTPTKEDDAAVLAAWKGLAAAQEQVVAYASANKAELMGERPNFDGQLAGLRAAVASTKKLIAMAETEGAVKVITRFGDSLRTEFAKRGGATPLPAKAGWTKTMVEVKSGEVVHLETTGTWTVSPKYPLFDADGLDQSGGFMDYRVYKGGKLGAVICRVTDSDKVYAGKTQRFMADMDGLLECRINDTDLSNNVGEVTVAHVPEPRK